MSSKSGFIDSFIIIFDVSIDASWNSISAFSKCDDTESNSFKLERDIILCIFKDIFSKLQSSI